MEEYIYKITNEKEILSGTVRALSVNDAAEQIKRKGWYILELKQKKGNLFSNFFKRRSQKISSFERINFTDHLSSMIAAGTPIMDALEAYTDNREKRSEMIDSISKDIEQGRSLSEAFSRFPNAFSVLYTSLVKAGETTGSLDETLEYLSNELRRENEFVQRIKSALYYPIIVISLSFVVIALVVTMVLPRIVEISKNLTGKTPLLTKIIINVSGLISKFGLPALGLFALGVFALIYLYKNKSTSNIVNSKLLNFPIVGDILKKYTLARLFRIIGSSVKYGIPIVDSMGSAISIAQTQNYQEALTRIKSRISKGASLSESISFEDKKLFPSIIIRTLKGAEKTGSVDKAALRLSMAYELQLDRDLKKITTMIEPMLIIFLGIIVALIAIAVITPIYQMTSRF
jgi:type II secretory pathway component PulF